MDHMPELRLVIDSIPPSANNYVRHVAKVGRDGRAFVSHYLTEKAKQWYWDIAAVAGGKQLRAPSYSVSYVVYRKDARVADVDNAAKVILDGLKHAQVIDKDELVTEIHGYKRIDRANPRTVIVVRTGQEELFGGSN